MSQMMRDGDLSTEGNLVASTFHEREAALKCWRDVVSTCGLDDKVLADAAGMKPSYFSKVSSGQQGDLLGMILQIGRTYPALRRAFITGLAEMECADPLVQAAEHLANAALRFVRLQSEALPMRMAKMELPRLGFQERRRA